MPYIPRTLVHVYESRRLNLDKLAAHYGGWQSLSERLGDGSFSASYLCQLVAPNGKRAISERTARLIEERLRWPPGTMDVPLSFQEIVTRCPRTE